MPYSKYHWQPPADQTFTYDPAKANADPRRRRLQGHHGDCYRETKGGKKLALRFYATSDSPENQTAAQAHRRLVQGRRHQAVSPGHRRRRASSTPSTTTRATPTRPTTTCSSGTGPRTWTRSSCSSIYTPQQIEGWNDCLLDRPRSTRSCYAQQSRPSTPPQRIPLVYQMQQSSTRLRPTSSSPTRTSSRPTTPTSWEGWVHVPGNAHRRQQGAVLYSYNNIDTYRFVEPKAASTAAATSSSTHGADRRHRNRGDRDHHHRRRAPAAAAASGSWNSGRAHRGVGPVDCRRAREGAAAADDRLAALSSPAGRQTFSLPAVPPRRAPRRRPGRPSSRVYT